MRTIITKADIENPIPVEVMEQSIVDIAAAMKKINATRLTRRAIVVLIQSRVATSQAVINMVLDNLADLEKNFLKPRK
jgi:hypothetical protein